MSARCLMALLITLSVFLGARRLVACEPVGKFPIRRERRELCRLESRALISKDCVNTSGQRLLCDSIKAVVALHKLLQGPDSGGGPKPPANVCREAGGEVILSRDESYNEYCFCRFPDHSVISCEGLMLEVRYRQQNSKGRAAGPS